MIAWVVSCIGKVNPAMRSVLLDNYESRRIINVKKWAESASVEEIMVIMTKLGFPMTLHGLGQNKQGNFPKVKAVRVFNEEGDIDLLVDGAAENLYFCITSREVMKMQVLYSQVLNGSWFVPNKDFKSFVRVMKETSSHLFEKNLVDFDYDNMKLVIKIFSNFLLSKQILDLNDIDYTILFYLACNDDKPIAHERIADLFAHKQTKGFVSRSLKKLIIYDYVQRYGNNHKKITYIINHKGWKAIELALKEFLRDIKFWDLEEKTKQLHTNEN